VEPALVELPKNGTAASRALNRKILGAAVGSKEVKLKLMYVVAVVGVVGLPIVGVAGLLIGAKKSLPTSKVLLLVQYVSRGASLNQ
jgi:GTPase involved in cell partitioning and DNA repair